MISADTTNVTPPATNDATAETRRNEEHGLHLYCAQELNNSAAMCLEKGLYERATSSLHNGLKLLIAMKHQNNNTRCCSYCSSNSRRNVRCHHECDHPCTLDGCIAFSEHTSFLFHSQCVEIGNSNSETESTITETTDTRTTTSTEKLEPSRGVAISKNGAKKRRLVTPPNTTKSTATKDDSEEKSSSNNGYLYRRPIRVPLEGFCHCNKGYTRLLVVIVFNLAIAHHLSALNGSSDAKTDNIAFLYGLCLELLYQPSSSSASSSSFPSQASPRSAPSPPESPQSTQRESSPSPAAALAPSPPPTEAPTTTAGTKRSYSSKSSIRCEMIIHNNLSQLHRRNGNGKEHQSSLQDLLQTLMVLIERGTRESSTAGHNRRRHWWALAAEQSPNGAASSELVEGVLENLDPLTRQEHCAIAA